MLFPAASAVAQDALARRRAAESSPRPEPRGSAQTILVVEDSEDVLALAREHLEALGYAVLTAGNADEALRVLAGPDAKVDLLFTDLIMPGSMNGLGLADEVRRTRPDLPVLFTTGYNEELVTDGQRAAGMDLIGKPYRRTELADRVNAALNRPSRPRRQPSREGGYKEG